MCIRDSNSPVIDSFYNIMEYSMYKTYAAKYSTSKKKIIAKYKKNGVFAVSYTHLDVYKRQAYLPLLCPKVNTAR